MSKTHFPIKRAIVGGAFVFALLVGAVAVDAEARAAEASKAGKTETVDGIAMKILTDGSNYKIVCIGGQQYFASRVSSFSTNFGIESKYWVIGGAVVKAGAFAACEM